jgi:adenylate cyclase
MSQRRKLAAILSADVVGYSRLMGDDERATIETLHVYRELIRERVERHQGRVVDSPGDALLSEFASAVEATDCAQEIQHELGKRNAQLAEHRRMQFRIGINLGDVIEENNALYGDGVNITARLEALADAGGICVSGAVFDQVQGKLPLQLQFMGEQQVKNIDHPIRVYRVLSASGATGRANRFVDRISVRKGKVIGLAAAAVIVVLLVAGRLYFTLPSHQPADTAGPEQNLPLPDKPSLAVLPFANMSGDPEQDYFSEGLTDTLITDLAKVNELFVIARNSSFTYKGKPVDVRQVGRELGVRYVVEGGVQKSAGRVRINVQLVEAATGRHVWAERYDRTLYDLFGLQSEITSRIVTELDVKLISGEMARTIRRGTNTLEAYELVMKGRRSWSQDNLEEGCELNRRGRQYDEQALSLDPAYAAAASDLAYLHLVDLYIGCPRPRDEILDSASRWAKNALSLDKDSALALTVLSMVHLFHKEFDKAVRVGRRAVNLTPNTAEVLANYAWVLYAANLVSESIVQIQQALRLHPHRPPWYDTVLALNYFSLGRYQEARSLLEEAERRWPGLNPHNLQLLAATYAALGRTEDAQEVGKTLMLRHPWFSIDVYFNVLSPHKDQERVDRLSSLLRQAGLR